LIGQNSNRAHGRSTHPGKNLILAILVLLLIAPGPIAAASPAESDSTMIERTVLELSRLQQRGNGNELYDWLSEMSRQRLPREAFVAWASSNLAFQPTADPEIRSITRGPWLWPVTGTTYPDIATVEIAQTGTLAGVATNILTTWHLQFDAQDQRWRWIFGDDLADLAAIARQPEPNLAFASAFEDDTYATIDRFWAGIFADLDRRYQPVLSIVEVHTEPLVTGCGTESDIDAIGIYMCLLDETIYYSPILQASVVAEFGEVGWQTVIAHEWSHQVQAQFNIAYGIEPELDGGHYILELETQADCMTGISFQELVGRNQMTPPDLQPVRRLLSSYGDYGDIEWDATNAHGTGAQRVQSFNNGYNNGFVGCGLDLDADAA
jgi:predicted metalloprotease